MSHRPQVRVHRPSLLGLIGAFFAAISLQCPARAQLPVFMGLGADGWAYDGVHDGAVDGDKLILAGSFEWIGKPCGSWVGFNTQTGEADEHGALVSGYVFAAAPDGRGGFFLGGTVAGVNGEARSGLAHVHADGSPSAWAPSVQGAVLALERMGDTLFVGGHFSEVNGVSRSNLAALDAGTGKLLAWDVPASATVRALHRVEDTLFVGGEFQTLGGQLKPGLGAIDALRGLLLPWGIPTSAWVAGGVAPVVHCLASDGDRLLVGGEFGVLGTAGASAFAAFQRSTGSLIPPRISNCCGLVRHILVHGGRVYLSGFVGAWPFGPEQSVVALARGTLEPIRWFSAAPRPERTSEALAAVGSRLFVGEGWYSTTEAPESVTAVDTLTGELLPYTPSAVTSGGPYAYKVSGEKLYVSAGFRVFRTTPRYRVAEIDLPTRTCTDRTFELLPNEGINVLAADAGRVFIQTWYGDLVGYGAGSVPLWRRPFAAARDMIAAQGHLLLAGQETVGGAEGVFDIDPETGVTTPWAPLFSEFVGYPRVERLAADDSRFYVGGAFRRVNGQVTGGIAAFRWLDLGLEPVGFTAIDRVCALAVGSGRVVAAGEVPGRTDVTILAFDQATGAPDFKWGLPGPLPSLYRYLVQDVAIMDDAVFTSYDYGWAPWVLGSTLYRSQLSAPKWSAVPSSHLYAASRLLSSAGRLFLFGPFIGAGPLTASGVAMFESPTLGVPPQRPPSIRLTAWPDPARDQMTLQWTGSLEPPSRLEVYDIGGRLLRRFELPANATESYQVELEDRDGRPLAPGVHFASLIDKSGGRRTTRFVVVH